MKKFLKLISVILCAVTVLSCAAVFSAAGKTYDKNAYGTNGEGKDTNIPLGTSYGIRLGINGEFCAVSVRLSTYVKADTKATVALYKWEGNYDDTISDKPKASHQFDPSTTI
ncbi:MAG: hypothetical protein IKH51_07580 [Clostridia bacterium]|nr:hypothetical protein [Clostridia bacterium]